MPFLVPLTLAGATALAGGAAAGASIYGAHKQSSASDKATAAALAANKEALDFEKQKYGDLQTRIAPWISAGQTANQRMTDFLNAPASTTSNIPTAAASDPSAWAAPVMMRSPDGQHRQVVPPHLIPHYLSRGAQVMA